MLQCKDITTISELKNKFTVEWIKPEFTYDLLHAISYSKVCKSFKDYKQKGYSFESVFTILISMIFIGEQTISSLTTGIWKNHIESKKDVFYRLKNNFYINWRKILWKTAMRFTEVVSQTTENMDGLKCLIFDDSVLSKTGKKIEKLGRVWDHVLQRSILGFKILVMGYWDGTSFIPLDFSLHREEGKNKEKPFGMTKREMKKQYRKKRPVTSCGQERVKELDIKKTESAIKMFWRAVKQGLKIDYVLMDSWFTCETFIKAVKKVENQTIHLIGMFKIVKQKFEYAGKMLTYNQIRSIQGKPTRCRKARLYYHQTRVLLNGTEMQMFFSRQGKNGKWKVIITTNLEISFVKLIEIYQIRWSIEVFFKERKQLLGMGKCQSNDFDGQIAEATITLIQYILLTLRYRFDTYESKGALFSQTKEEATQLRLNERLWGLLLVILDIMENLFDIDAVDIIEQILNNEVAFNKLKRLFDESLPKETSMVA